MYKHIPKVSKNTFLYKSDYKSGNYDRAKNIFNVYSDLNELEIFFAYFE